VRQNTKQSRVEISFYFLIYREFSVFAGDPSGGKDVESRLKRADFFSKKYGIKC